MDACFLSTGRQHPHCRSLFWLLCLGALGLALAQPTTAAPVSLAKDGEARAIIATGEDAGPVVRFAAGELKRKLDAITGASFRVVEQPPADGTAIVLGDQPAARDAGVDVTPLKRDGYIIKTRGNRLYIAGRDSDREKAGKLFDLLDETPIGSLGRNKIRYQYSPARWHFQRATLFGVYDFLRRLGVRWYFPGPHGEVLPDASTLTVQPMDVREEPAFEMRRVNQLSYRYHSSFGAKPDMYNDAEWTAEQDMLFRLRLRNSTTWLAFNGRPQRHNWVKRFGDAHPEYFALLERGRRENFNAKFSPHLCYSSDGAFNETLREIDAYFTGKHATSLGIDWHRRVGIESNRGWPVMTAYGDTFSVFPNDGFNICLCPRCQPLVPDEARYSARASELVWRFVDRVARAVKPKFPDKHITCIAYSMYKAPPRTIDKLPDNVIAGAIPPTDKPGRFFSQIQPSSRRAYRENMQAWNEKTAGPLLTWVNDQFRMNRPQHDNVPMTLPGQYAAYTRIWQDSNVKWAFVLQRDDEPFMMHLRRYLWYRMMWNPQADVDRIVRTYIQKTYGPAASPMRRLWDDVFDRCRSIAEATPGQVGIWSNHLTADVVKRYGEWIDEAHQLAPQGSGAAKRVELFDRFFVQVIERGRDWYERNIADVMGSDASKVTARKAWQPITVDGALDEDVWRLSDRIEPFHGNKTDEPTEWNTQARVLYDGKTLYFAFICEDPNAAARNAKTSSDWVELFLDPDHDHDDYYQIMVDMAGRVRVDNHGTGKKSLAESWTSGATAAVQRGADRWVVEIALPRARMAAGEVTPGAKHSAEPDRPWGINFCRTIGAPPRKQDRFSCFSPLLRGGFHQPELFAHLYFD